MNINNPTTFSAPALVFSTSNSSGTSGALRANDTLAIFSTTVPTNISTSTVSASTGDNAFGSREDHVHGSTAVLGAASEAEMEAASSTTVFASPGRTQNHPGVAKVWVKWEQTGAHALIVSYNMNSVTDGGAVGDTDHVFEVDFSSTDYAPVGMVGGGDNSIANLSGFAAGTMRTYTFVSASGSGIDLNDNHVAIFGTQA